MIKTFVWVCALAIAAISAPAVAQDKPRQERIEFAIGKSGATIKGRIKGYEVVRYMLGAQAGQRMTVALNTSNTYTYFNVIQPSHPEGPALAISEQAGSNPMVPDLNRFDGVLPESGDYGIEVWMYRAAARRGDTADFTLDVEILPK
jgi:hypothetical protein